MGFCGFVRTTEVIDILVRASEDNIKALSAAMAELGEGFGGGITLEDMPLEPGCVRVAEEDCPVDIFTLMDGKTYEEQFPLSEVFGLKNLEREIRHLSRRQLISAKSSSFREKDQIDVDALTRLERGESLI